MNEATYQRAVECCAKVVFDAGEEEPSDECLQLIAALFSRDTKHITEDVAELLEKMADEEEEEENCGEGVDERGCYCGRCPSQWSAEERRVRSQDEGDCA